MQEETLYLNAFLQSPLSCMGNKNAFVLLKYSLTLKQSFQICHHYEKMKGPLPFQCAVGQVINFDHMMQFFMVLSNSIHSMSLFS